MLLQFVLPYGNVVVSHSEQLSFISWPQGGSEAHKSCKHIKSTLTFEPKNLFLIMFKKEL